MARTAHTPVLLHETIDGLALSPDATVIDATLGSGGHTSLILEKLGTDGTLLAIDADPTAIAGFEAPARANGPTLILATGNFRSIAEIAKVEGITSADAIVADLGWRMEQFSEGGRGFSFTADEPLHMTFGDSEAYSFTAANIVNEWHETDIANVLKGYGEERYARKIAQAIVGARPLHTARALGEVVFSAVPSHYRRGRIHPATKTFQALRIAVNDELSALSEFIDQSVALLTPGGRLAIITFHSIEDRIAKHQMRQYADNGVARRITKKPITPSAEEVTNNPRARSAKLRIIEKI